MYRAFWDKLRPELLEVCREIYRKGVLSNSMREGIISLLFKKGDTDQIKNCRHTLVCRPEAGGKGPYGAFKKGPAVGNRGGPDVRDRREADGLEPSPGLGRHQLGA